ncbi:MAG: hypothetical protein AAGF24_06095 [Cyanobacteria bacterium P01_H01_bin.121]
MAGLHPGLLRSIDEQVQELTSHQSDAAAEAAFYADQMERAAIAAAEINRQGSPTLPAGDAADPTTAPAPLTGGQATQPIAPSQAPEDQAAIAAEFSPDLEQSAVFADILQQSLIRSIDVTTELQGTSGLLADEIDRAAIAAEALSKNLNAVPLSILDLTGVEGRRTGGDVYAGRAYIAGEGGVPELIVPKVDGYVYNGRETASILRYLQSGGTTLSPTVNVATQAITSPSTTNLDPLLQEIRTLRHGFSKARSIGSMPIQINNQNIPQTKVMGDLIEQSEIRLFRKLRRLLTN